MATEDQSIKTNFIFLWWRKIILLFIIIVIVFPIISFFSLFFITQVPKNFQENIIIEIKPNTNISQIAYILEKKKLIKSATVFKLYNWYIEKTQKGVNMMAGHYRFPIPLNMFDVYDRLRKGVSGIKNISFVVKDGESNFSIAKRLSEKFPKRISEEKFLKLAKDYEGYLYPDTYEFSPYEVSEEIIIQTMNNNFLEKIKEIKNAIDKSRLSLKKIVIMASLIEMETRGWDYQTKRKVSGVLWRRLQIGMPLQVDAVFDYIYKKHISRKLYSHLKIESPYNLYLNKGLPPTPIGNPTFSSIQAALWPNDLGYLYYLTGKDHKFYFSKNLEEHNFNKNKYIINYKVDSMVK